MTKASWGGGDSVFEDPGGEKIEEGNKNFHLQAGEEPTTLDTMGEWFKLLTRLDESKLNTSNTSK